MEADSNNFIGVWRDYLRVRVSIDLTKPLKRHMKLKRSNDSWCWVNFKYEGVPTFCFICGMVGHGEKFCAKIFDTPLDKIEKPYGVWMKAEPKRRNYTIGAKWLRKGGRIPVNLATAQGTGGSGLTDSMIVAVGSNSSRISGGKQDIVAVQKDTGKGDNMGANISRNKVDLVVISLNIGGKDELELAESSGLFFLEQKRRRVDESSPIGPAGGDFIINSNMTDAQIQKT